MRRINYSLFILVVGFHLNVRPLIASELPAGNRCQELEEEYKTLFNEEHKISLAKNSENLSALKIKYNQLAMEYQTLQGLKKLNESYRQSREELKDLIAHPNQINSDIESAYKKIADNYTKGYHVALMDETLKAINNDEFLNDFLPKGRFKTDWGYSIRDDAKKKDIERHIVKKCNGNTVEGFKKFCEIYSKTNSSGETDADRIIMKNRGRDYLNGYIMHFHEKLMADRKKFPSLEKSSDFKEALQEYFGNAHFALSDDVPSEEAQVFYKEIFKKDNKIKDLPLNLGIATDYDPVSESFKELHNQYVKFKNSKRNVPDEALNCFMKKSAGASSSKNDCFEGTTANKIDLTADYENLKNLSKKYIDNYEKFQRGITSDGNSRTLATKDYLKFADVENLIGSYKGKFKDVENKNKEAISKTSAKIEAAKKAFQRKLSCLKTDDDKVKKLHMTRSGKALDSSAITKANSEISKIFGLSGGDSSLISNTSDGNGNFKLNSNALAKIMENYEGNKEEFDKYLEKLKNDLDSAAKGIADAKENKDIQRIRGLKDNTLAAIKNECYSTKKVTNDIAYSCVKNQDVGQRISSFIKINGQIIGDLLSEEKGGPISVDAYQAKVLCDELSKEQKAKHKKNCDRVYKDFVAKKESDRRREKRRNARSKVMVTYDRDGRPTGAVKLIGSKTDIALQGISQGFLNVGVSGALNLINLDSRINSLNLGVQQMESCYNNSVEYMGNSYFPCNYFGSPQSYYPMQPYSFGSNTSYTPTGSTNSGFSF